MRPSPRSAGDPHERRYAARMAGFRSSAMRDLMAVTARPEVISLAGGLPDTRSFDPDLLASLLGDLAHTQAADALQYGPTEGYAPLAERICALMAAEGAPARPEDVTITTGGQQALDLIARAFVDPGDVVLAEAPTYPGALPVFSSYQATVDQVDVDADGLDVDALERRLDVWESVGRTPKYVYCVPTFQNPAGVSMSLARRRALIALAARRDLLLVEDNPYGLLRYEGDALPTLLELDRGAGRVVYVGTFSKVLSAGVRVGWVVAPPPVRRRIVLGKQAADLCTSSLTQRFVADFFADADRWQTYLATLRGIYRARRDALLTALAEHFPAEASVSRPAGGLFCWVRLPAGLDTGALLARALTADVAFVPGGAAYVDPERGRAAMRLNFSGVPEDRIREGVRRLGVVIDESLELFHAMHDDRPTARPALGHEPGEAPPGYRPLGADEAPARASSGVKPGP